MFLTSSLYALMTVQVKCLLSLQIYYHEVESFVWKFDGIMADQREFYKNIKKKVINFYILLWTFIFFVLP